MKKTKERKKLLNIHSVKFKLFTSLILLIIIPLFMLGGLSYRKSFDKLKTQSDYNVNQLNSQINETLIEFFSSLEKDVLMLSQQEGLANLVEREEISSEVFDESKNISIANARAFLGYMVNENENVKAAYIGTRNKNMYSGKGRYLFGIDGTRDPRESSWYTSAVKTPDKVIWTKPEIDNNKENKETVIVITAAKAIKFNNEIVGVMAIDINLKHLVSKINSIKVGEKGYVVITDSLGEVLIHKDSKKVGSKIQFSQIIPMLTSSTGEKEISVDGGKDYIEFVTNPNTQWKLICVFPYDDLYKSTNEILTFTLILTLGFALFSMFTMDLVCRKMILKPINILKDTFLKVSKGDLTAEAHIKSKDEFKDIGESFNHMINEIGSIIKGVKDASLIISDKTESLTAISQTTTKAANDIAYSVQDISRTSLEQAETTEAEENRIQSISREIDNISKSISHIKKNFDETKNLNAKGLQILRNLTSKTNETLDAESNLKNIVMDVDTGSKKIESIVTAINDISKQTNLLALNASIESARAGAAGKGFSVVAKEVRDLAEESASAVKGIQTLVSDIQTKSNNAVSTIISNEGLMSQQGDAVNNTQQIFNNIISQIEMLYDDMSSIESINTEIMSKKNELLSSIENISLLADKNSQASEEASASTEEAFANVEELDSHISSLKDLSDNLEVILKKFKI